MPAVTKSATWRNRVPRPFLKWAGGKSRLLKELTKRLPEQRAPYFEPFVGGGALFFDLRPSPAVLTDVNAELIDAYTAVRDDVEAVITALQRHRYDKAYYYEIRRQAPADLRLAERAARTIYLNKAGFNGLYRVNKKGLFNVPFGRYTNPTLCDVDNLRGCAKALAGVEIAVRDFADVVGWAAPGSFVYFDPPYAPLSATSDFTSYIPGGFGVGEQEKLAEVFHALTAKGVRAMLSNSSVDVIHELYAGYRVDIVPVIRTINSTSARRGAVDEVVVRNYDDRGRVKRRRR